MMWLLLFGLTALVILLPLLPALAEWLWPTDVVPLFIDKDDALDPPFLARSFASRLATAQALGQPRLGRSRICTFVPRTPWPLDKTERSAASSRRVWDVIGDAELPAGVTFLGEVASRGSMRAAPGAVYRGLWAGAGLQLGAGCTVLRWAHGTQVEVGAGCRLAGRTSADERITVAGGTAFALLHAPQVLFAPGARSAAPIAWTPITLVSGVPKSVHWDARSARGRCETSLDIAPGRCWTGDLVCGADLRLGAGCHVQGSLKARGSLVLGAGCTISGSVVAEGAIRLELGCTVRGSVVSETAIVLGERCVIGGIGCPSTVAAPRLDVGRGVVAHGTVWAGESGRCAPSDTAWPVAVEALAPARSARPAQEATA